MFCFFWLIWRDFRSQWENTICGCLYVCVCAWVETEFIESTNFSDNESTRAALILGLMIMPMPNQLPAANI